MLFISQSVYNIISEHAARSYPAECCGLLLGIEQGTERHIVEVVACENKAVQSENRFSISAKEYITGEIAAEEKGLVLIGIYHSHPDCEAVPSATDKASAFPFFSYLILSIQQGVQTSARSWQLNNTSALIEEKISIRNNNHLKKETAYGNHNYSNTIAKIHG